MSQEEAILKELREISDRYSSHNIKDQGLRSIKRPRDVVEDGICYENAFLSQIEEDRDLNQYWYSQQTIEVLRDAIREGLLLSNGRRVAFLSTPSLFFSLSMEEREHCALFEVSQFESSFISSIGFPLTHQVILITSLILPWSIARGITSTITTIHMKLKTPAATRLIWSL
jgi:hypothetical protein